jgi:hypothetical protein
LAGRRCERGGLVIRFPGVYGWHVSGEGQWGGSLTQPNCQQLGNPVEQFVWRILNV